MRATLRKLVTCFGCHRLVPWGATEGHRVEHAEPPYWRQERFCTQCVEREVML